MATLHRQAIITWFLSRARRRSCWGSAAECRLDAWAGVPGMTDHFAREGLRVLGMAYKKSRPTLMEISHGDLQTGLTFAGLQGMIDPPRPEAIEAVAGCKKAGIRVVMITGDHAVTALAIAKKLGIAPEEDVVEDLVAKPVDSLTDEEILSLLTTVAPVFGRTVRIGPNIILKPSPADMSRI